MRELLDRAQEAIQDCEAGLNQLEAAILAILNERQATWGQINRALQNGCQIPANPVWVGIALADLCIRGFVDWGLSRAFPEQLLACQDPNGSNRDLPGLPTLIFSAKPPERDQLVPVPVRVRSRSS